MLYSLLLALFYGVLEGVTEWLPVSSTGHLILLRAILPQSLDDAFFALFEVVVQLGAIAAVPVLFWGDLFPLSKRKSTEEKRDTLRLWGKIALATLPAAILGFLLDDTLERLFYHPLPVAAVLIFYGVFFLLPVGRVQENRTPSPDISAKAALGIGLFQSLALIPGTSRSGITLLGATALGVPRTVATRFSFFLALPTMVGAGLLKTCKFFAAGNTLTGKEGLLLAAGALTAFLVSLAVIRFLLDFVRTHSLALFGWWRILLGGAVLLYYFL